jgi:hypothetical protein
MILNIKPFAFEHSLSVRPLSYSYNKGSLTTTSTTKTVAPTPRTAAGVKQRMKKKGKKKKGKKKKGKAKLNNDERLLKTYIKNLHKAY